MIGSQLRIIWCALELIIILRHDNCIIHSYYCMHMDT